MKVLVTGADGFVGQHLVTRLRAAGHDVVGTRRPGHETPLGAAAGDAAIEWLPLELADNASVRRAAAGRPDAVVHLAALASGAEARRDPARAWTVNAAGTARLLEALAAERIAGNTGPRVLLVSTGEVYGAGAPVPRRETDPVAPRSPYAASKLGAEIAALETWRRTGLPVIVARAFAHTGAGQAPTYVVPAFAARLREAGAAGRRTVPTGNLDPVRDLLDVRDVVEAYVALLDRGEPGEIYNVARGEGIALRDIFEQLARALGVDAAPEPDPELVRSSDLPYLVGDAAKLRRATGWQLAIPLEQTLRGIVDAQAD